ncbi:MAG: DUF1592 domain-containing protein [Bryobacterales bacterium]|nr:DUF1592 domain-containing protein [Bryobacterales bacterium]
MRCTVLLIAAGVSLYAQPPVSFEKDVFPVFEKAGCRHCHNRDGVAGPTRLRFPEDGADAKQLADFGDSLVVLVDRKAPDASALLQKPTNRLKHSGGERIAQGSAEESVLRRWVAILARRSDAEVARIREQRPAERGGQVQGAVLRRLTHQQYANTIRDLLHEASDVANQFPPEDFVDGFKNQYKNQTLSPIQVEAYSLMAERMAQAAFRRGDSRKLIPCDYRGGKQDACRAEFVRTFGRRAFRRPLEAAEFARYEALFKAEKDFITGVQAVIEAMLQSPAFLFWMEDTARDDWKPYAAASRLSYFLWNTMPDDALLDAAAAGELHSTQAVVQAAKRMIDNPKAKPALDEFVSQWLRFDRAFAAARERRTFPQFSRELVAAMVEESKRFVGDLVWNDRNFMDLFRANYGFVNADLAAVYQVQAPSRDFEKVEFKPEHQRPGILGQAMFLTLTSKPEDTAPTSRGLFVREQFLCQQVPPPPANVDNNLPPVSVARPVTNRERLKEHTFNKACTSCHSLIDPIGFTLEKFDAIGMWRDRHKLLFYPDEHEAKKPMKEVMLDLDTNGQIAGIPNSEFTNPRELGELLAKTPQCQECITKQVFRYMAGRRDTPADVPMITEATARFRESGFKFKELLICLLTSRDREARGKALHAQRHN